MLQLLLVLWSFLPAFAWLLYIHRKDHYEREPLGQILKVFFAGMLVTIPAGVINSVLAAIFPDYAGTHQGIALFTMLVVGPNEELWKFLAAYLLMYRHNEFDEPMDGLVYACTAALGFAGLENVQYMFTHGASVIVMRALTAVPMHFAAAAIVGYAMGMRKFGHRSVGIPLALAIAAALHGLYDFFAFSARLGNGVIMLLLLAAQLVLHAVWLRFAIKRLLALSPFRSGADDRTCGGCGKATPADSVFCHHCGACVSSEVSLPEHAAARPPLG